MNAWPNDLVRTQKPCMYMYMCVYIYTHTHTHMYSYSPVTTRGRTCNNCTI